MSAIRQPYVRPVMKAAAAALLTALALPCPQPAAAAGPGIDELQKGVQAFGAGRFKQSLDLLNRAAIAMPQNPFLLLARADTLLRLNRSKEALKDLEKSLQVARYKGGTHSRLGLCYMQLHQPALAEKELEQAIALNEMDLLRWASWIDYLNLASARKSLRKFAEAESAAKLGNRLRLQNEARDLREAINLPEAVKIAEAALKVKADDTYSRYFLGIVHLNAGMSSQAAADFSWIIKRQPREPLAYYFRADAYLDSGKVMAAVKDYSTIIGAAPPVVALVDVAETGRCKSSGRAYDETAVTLADIYYLRASAYRRLNKLKEARSDLNTCLKLAPGDLEAKILNIDFLAGEGKKKEALSELEKLVKANPQDIHCLQLTADTYAQMGLFEKARETANQLVTVSHNETNALLCRAKILEKLDRWQESIADYSLALKNDDFNEDALTGRARAFAQLGNWSAVLKDCNAAIKFADSPRAELTQLKAKALQKLGKQAK